MKIAMVQGNIILSNKCSNIQKILTNKMKKLQHTA